MSHQLGCGCSNCLAQTPVPSTSCFKPCPCEETPYPCDKTLPAVAMPVPQQVGCNTGCVDIISATCVKCLILPFIQSISKAGNNASFVFNTASIKEGSYNITVNGVDNGVVRYGHPLAGTVNVGASATYEITFVITDATDTSCVKTFVYSNLPIG